MRVDPVSILTRVGASIMAAIAFFLMLLAVPLGAAWSASPPAGLLGGIVAIGAIAAPLAIPFLTAVFVVWDLLASRVIARPTIDMFATSAVYGGLFALWAAFASEGSAGVIPMFAFGALAGAMARAIQTRLIRGGPRTS